MRERLSHATLGFDMNIRVLLAVFALTSLTLVVACGGGGDDGDGVDEGPTPTAASLGEPPDAPGGNAAGVPGPDSPVISITSPSIDVDSEGTATLDVVFEQMPGIGAWTIDIKFNANIVSVADCDPVLGTAVCNPEYENDIVRVVGASLGIESESTLGHITFLCEQAGETALDITIDTLADATIGDPRLLAAHVEDGTITCS
jgi:hypothetical protein